MKFVLRVCFLCLAATPGFAQFSTETDSLTEKIPPLQPPRAVIPPTFWDQYGTLVIFGAALLVIIIAAVVWMLTRPTPAAVVPPVIQARTDLEKLQHQPEDGVTLSRVSQILRRYVTTAFNLPPAEMTTAEFCNAISERGNLGKNISTDLTTFLNECDQRKFAPAPPATTFGAVPTALKLLAAAETRREQLHQTAADMPPIRGATKGPTA